MNRVVVGMSGGVDSSVAAARLIELGYQVTGVMLRLWSDEIQNVENSCCTIESVAMARKIASILGIPFYVIDAKEQFHRRIISYFIDGYKKGRTPNPCIICNKTIRWGFMLETARAMGADYLATGHYARIVEGEHNRFHLLRGMDRDKDQSYVLSMLNQEQLSRTMLPLGDFNKSEVRELARKHSLPVSERKDSQDLCFLAGRDYRDFIRRSIKSASTTGEIIDQSGKKLGMHSGLEGFTIGQRKGLNLQGGQPYYVIEIDREKNRLIVSNNDELGRSKFDVQNINWISGTAPQQEFEANVKIRYRSRDFPARITPNTHSAIVELIEPARDITPGQFAVFYQGDEVLGGGEICDGERTGG